MDMNHDFTPDPEVHAGDSGRRTVPMELFLIGAVFVAVWLAFGAQILVHGLH